MALKEIFSHNELLDNVKDKDRAYVLLYKKGSEVSDCSFDNISKAVKNTDEIDVLVVDVGQVREIHSHYGIKSAPSLLTFENGEYKNVVKGCNQSNYYKSLFENQVFVASNVEDAPRQKSVTVYSTPTCTWCNTLKTYLRKHNIRFRDIDVSANQSLAEELVRKSGQQGVPQTEIDGQIIVGFDKNRINQMLGIKG